MNEIFNDFAAILKYKTGHMAHKNRSNWSPYKAKQKAGVAKPTDGPDKPAHRAGDARPATRPATRPNARPAAPGDNQGSAQLKGKHRRSEESFSLDEAEDRLRDVFERHGLQDFPHAKRRTLARFYMLLMDNQNERNFTRLLTLRDVGIKHFVDCLVVPELLRQNEVPLLFPLLDVGTGPGFPGIPLKILFPDQRIILAEGVQKRVEFLKSIRDELGLGSPDAPLDILGRNINSEVFLPVNGVITRAVEDASNTLGNVIHTLQTGGRVYLMKGPNCGPEIPMALEKWSEYYRLEKDIAYTLKGTPHERRLLVFQKLKSYPLPDFEELDLAWEREHGQ